ncbi:MAG: cysteine hydrolase [Deltaproteobacteria bacterium]|nr:cysteine hydrolase [Deltaproteobacteria bacterium]
MREALIVVDMLRDFIDPDGALRVPGGQAIVPAVLRELERARQEGHLVAFVCDSHAPDDLEFSRFPPHAVTGTAGAEIIPGLKPRSGEIVVPKRRLDPFFDTELADLLKREKVTQATVVGVCTHICVMETVGSLSSMDIPARVPRDAVADFDPEMETAALKRMASVFGTDITSDGV